MGEIVLETRGLSHIYSENTPFMRLALNQVNFTLEQGECVGVIGHTGSGKSTFMQHMNGLLKPSSGEVLFCGKDIWSDSAYTKETRFRVGLVFQYPEYQLFEETVYQDIAYGPKNMGLSSEEVHRRVMEASQFVGLSDTLLEKSPFQLSGGQKRRVAIAGVVAMEPRVLILDEPTAGLDPQGAKEILEKIREYQQTRGASVMFVSHSMEDVANMVDRLVVFEGGEIPLQGTVEEVFSHSQALQEMGLGIPQMTQLMDKLREQGLEIPEQVYTVEQTVDLVLRMLEKTQGGTPWH